MEPTRKSGLAVRGKAYPLRPHSTRNVSLAKFEIGSTIVLMNQVPPSGWALEGDALTRNIQRSDFIEAIALVLKIVPLAEAADHHPDIDIRYRTVRLSLSTHSAGDKVTVRDFALAGQINAIPEGDITSCAAELRSRLKP
jgi:4a-hydroxytetrahydrobiopterin dehydratase